MHGPSSTGEQRGCRGLCPGLAYERLRGCLSLVALVPRLVTSKLTDAQNALYHCLPNHALRWLKVSEAAPASKRIRVFY